MKNYKLMCTDCWLSRIIQLKLLGFFFVRVFFFFKAPENIMFTSL